MSKLVGHMCRVAHLLGVLRCLRAHSMCRGSGPLPLLTLITIRGRGPCPLEGNLAALLGAHNPRCYYARGHGEDST